MKNCSMVSDVGRRLNGKNSSRKLYAGDKEEGKR
jgi:hypothetical protein